MDNFLKLSKLTFFCMQINKITKFSRIHLKHLGSIGVYGRVMILIHLALVISPFVTRCLFFVMQSTDCQRVCG